MEKLDFNSAVKQWLIDNEYIGNTWRFNIISKDILKNSDIAEICCEAYKPRKRKPFYISFKYNFVREQIYTNTIKVDGLN